MCSFLYRAIINLTLKLYLRIFSKVFCKRMVKAVHAVSQPCTKNFMEQIYENFCISGVLELSLNFFDRGEQNLVMFEVSKLHSRNLYEWQDRIQLFCAEHNKKFEFDFFLPMERASKS